MSSHKGWRKQESSVLQKPQEDFRSRRGKNSTWGPQGPWGPLPCLLKDVDPVGGLWPQAPFPLSFHSEQGPDLPYTGIRMPGVDH